ncbi:hypothetical protein TRIUR3_08028 [Triticum urartu]|uniref:Lysine ketoglutarate reductase trans-splicing protein n=1 Tax=Triticum urartu TaxID=4572 RepID=M7Z4Z2_TRIUA|nr:hypothetical protein TRIUR3_08028 [Triticum urartu]
MRELYEPTRARLGLWAHGPEQKIKDKLKFQTRGRGQRSSHVLVVAKARHRRCGVASKITKSATSLIHLGHLGYDGGHTQVGPALGQIAHDHCIKDTIFPTNKGSAAGCNEYRGSEQRGIYPTPAHQLIYTQTIPTKLQCGVLPWSGSTNSSSSESFLGRLWAPLLRNSSSTSNATTGIARRPEGAGRLPPGIVVSESDLHLRRLWGSPSQDAPVRKYLLTMAVGHKERVNVNATVHKFSDKFDMLMFHYDGHTTEWDDEFQWSKEAVHVSARKQTKWWFAKRFLHPSIVAPYDYVFLWDEDLGVENFNAEAYIDIVKKHGLEISQPGLDSTKGKSAYKVSVKRNSGEMHK